MEGPIHGWKARAQPATPRSLSSDGASSARRSRCIASRSLRSIHAARIAPAPWTRATERNGVDRPDRRARAARAPRHLGRGARAARRRRRRRRSRRDDRMPATLGADEVPELPAARARSTPTSTRRRCRRGPGPSTSRTTCTAAATYLTACGCRRARSRPPAGAVDVRAIAEQLARDLPYPHATVHVSPDGRGLTGLESWFWVDGLLRRRCATRSTGSGSGSRSRRVPAAVRWDFGDGTPAQAGTLGHGRAGPLGRRAHLRAAQPGGAADASGPSVRLDVRYRVDGEPWQALDPVFRTATRAYPVAESRAALVAPR